MLTAVCGDMNNRIIYAIALVVIIAIAAAVLYLNTSGSSNLSSYVGQQVPQSQISALENIAANSTLANNVGSGLLPSSSFPTLLKNKSITVVDGKPAVVYVGAEYCPYCAFTRWGFIIALMRFGSLSDLHYMLSSPTDVYASTPTFTFYNSSYSSSVITFLPTEIENRSEQSLQQPSALQLADISAYDPSTASCDGGGCIPFIDFGNRSVVVGLPSSLSPGFIRTMTWSQIISQLSKSNTTVSQAIIGQADVFTAQICAIDNMTPTSVCSQPYVSKILGSA